jgi:hypothetical protein
MLFSIDYHHNSQTVLQAQGGIDVNAQAGMHACITLKGMTQGNTRVKSAWHSQLLRNEHSWQNMANRSGLLVLMDSLDDIY